MQWSSAARGEATPATALKQAVDKFEEITKADGREAKLKAYRRHLGLEDVASP